MTATITEPGRRARWVAVLAAAATAALYGLIGLGVLPIGVPADGSPPDLVGFGLGLGGIFALVAVSVALVRHRAVLAVAAALQVLVIVGYFALASVREPQFEVWGLVVKGCQAVLLVAVGYMLLAGRRTGLRGIGARTTTAPHAS